MESEAAMRTISLFAVALALIAKHGLVYAADELGKMPFEQPAILWLPANSTTVQRELKLNAGQLSKLQELATGEVGDAQKLARRKERLAEILAPVQLARLQQIAWQVRPEEGLRSPEAAEALRLSTEQQRDIHAAWEAGQTALVSDLRRIRFQSELDRSKFIRERAAKIADDMRSALTDPQREKFTKLLGKPLKFREVAQPRR
jgi:hypothetical protein